MVRLRLLTPTSCVHSCEHSCSIVVLSCRTLVLE